ncbi:MAG TPA: hypothetical protein VFQ30_02380 [Ktedonobacteraceae bacterium]|nr:hypothetical protein [Ktedonobacteraceae bacterium]
MISHHGTTARCALANQLHQCSPPRIRFLLIQESPAERITFE